MVVTAVSMSLAGGADRKAVADLLAELVNRLPHWPVDSGAKQSLESFNAAASLLQYWATESEFLDQSATPRALPIAGRGASFASLVRKSGGFKSAAAALEMLERHGAVHREGKTVRLLSRALVANWETAEARERAFSLGAASLKTFARNLSDRPHSEKRYERSVTSLKFPVAAREALRGHLKLHSEALLVYIDQLMKNYEQAAEARGEATEAVAFELIELDLPAYGTADMTQRRGRDLKRKQRGA
jgi:hypothetical protein